MLSVKALAPRYITPMRVIAGMYRGRPLLSPPTDSTRPILDRVKVSLFDWLGSMLAQPGSLPPIAVLDLFCGSGSLGIEALSRGATYCAFVEKDRPTARCLQQNIDALGIPGAQVRVLTESADLVQTAPPAPADAFDLIFLDPPYVLSEDLRPESTMSRILARLGAQIPVSQDAIALWRTDEHVHLPPVLPHGWHSSERRVWGSMAITLLSRSPQVPD